MLRATVAESPRLKPGNRIKFVRTVSLIVRASFLSNIHGRVKDKRRTEKNGRERIVKARTYGKKSRNSFPRTNVPIEVKVLAQGRFERAMNWLIGQPSKVARTGWHIILI